MGWTNEKAGRGSGACLDQWEAGNVRWDVTSESDHQLRRASHRDEIHSVSTLAEAEQFGTDRGAAQPLSQTLSRTQGLRQPAVVLSKPVATKLLSTAADTYSKVRVINIPASPCHNIGFV